MSGNVTRMDAFQAKRAEAERKATGDEPQLPLYGGGGPTGMEPTPSWKDYIDAKDDAVESRLNHNLGALSTAKEVRNNVWGAAAAIIGIVLAMLAFGGDRFDGGMSVSSIVAAVQNGQRAVDERQDAKLEAMDRKLDVLLERSAGR